MHQKTKDGWSIVVTNLIRVLFVFYGKAVTRAVAKEIVSDKNVTTALIVAYIVYNRMIQYSAIAV